MYRNFIERDRPVFYYSPTDAKCTHLINADDKGFKLSSVTHSFEIYFSSKPLTLEAWIYPVHVEGQSSILSFDSSNGLFINEDEIHFVVADQRLSYTYSSEILHVVCTLNNNQISMYVNTNLVASEIITSPPVTKKTTLSTSSNLSSRIFGAGFAGYKNAFSFEQIKNHFNLGRKENNLFQIVSSMGSTYYELNKYVNNPINVVGYSSGEWGGLIENLDFSNTLKSVTVDDQYEYGQWQFDYYKDDELQERTLALDWEGTGVNVNRLDQGQWIPVKKNEPILLAQEVIFQVEFQQGKFGELEYMNISAYQEIAVNNLVLDADAVLGELFYPQEAKESTGMIGAGVITIPEETLIKAMQLWIKHDGNDLSILNQFAGTFYINGVQRDFDSTYDKNKWIHVVKVFATDRTGLLQIGKNGTNKVKGEVGLVSLFESTPTSQNVYSKYFASPYRVDEAASTTVVEDKPKIYGHNWSIISV